MKCDGQPPLREKVTGGANVAVVGMGYRGLLEVEGGVWWQRTCACGNSCWYCDDGSCGLASATEIDVFGSWRADGSRAGKTSLVVVSAATVLRWHHRGWRAYWRWWSRRGAKAGRHPIAQELQALIRRMAAENRSWGRRRIQAELARLGFKVSARTVAKYMQRPTHRRPSPGGWRLFLKQHAATIWACDFFCVQTILFRTFYVFFVIHHASRQVLHVHVTSHRTAEWTAQQIVECCGWDYEPPRFLVSARLLLLKAGSRPYRACMSFLPEHRPCASSLPGVRL